MWIRHSEFPGYPCLLTFRLKSGLNTVVWATLGPKNITRTVLFKYNVKELKTELNFIFIVWVWILHLMSKNLPGENHQNVVPSNRNIHLPAAWVPTDRLHYVGDLPLWGCLRNEASKARHWAARCTVNVFACLMRARRGSWILVIWVRMRLAACHGRSSLITYALAHN